LTCAQEVKTWEVGGFKGSSTRVVDESASLGRGQDAKGAWLKRTTHSCMLKRLVTIA